MYLLKYLLKIIKIEQRSAFREPVLTLVTKRKALSLCERKVAAETVVEAATPL